MSEQHVSYQDQCGNEARIAYTRIGQGTPIVLIHGVGLQGAIWRPQVAAFAADHDVIAVDMLGHGGSSLPPAHVSLADYADAILALLNALEIGRTHIVGHSMGALVAIEFALAHPDRTVSLVAMNAVYCRTPAQRAAIEARVAALSEDPASPDWSATIGRWFGEPVPPSLRTAAAHAGALLSEIDKVGYERTYGLFARADAAHRDRLPQLAVPALFMTGEDDPNSTPAMSEAMAGVASGGRSLILPGARHMMALTDPERTNRALRDFVGETERRQGAEAPAAIGLPDRPDKDSTR